MAYLQLHIKYDASLVTARAHGQIMNRLFRGALEHHKQQILPRHFENVPETRPHGAYGYAPRSKKWQERKRREGRGDRPDVYTGQMRTVVTRQSKVAATRKGGTLSVKNYFALTDQRRREVETISDREQQRMAGRMQIEYGKLARSPEFARKRAPKRIK